MASTMNNTDIYDKVQEHYSSVVNGGLKDNEQYIAASFGYTAEDLKSIPLESNFGLSCGNPLAIATLVEGETVVDLGAGAGFDVFLAAKKVGTSGVAIGVDQNDDMLRKANENAKKTQIHNVRFIKSPITEIDLHDNIADCVISNCVINLVPEPEKPTVFKEIFRLLKSGGRVAVSDILSRKEMTREIREDMSLYVGCIAGASRVDQYEDYLRQAGFVDIKISDSLDSINVHNPTNGTGSKKAVQSCCGVSCGSKSMPSTIDFDEWAGSFKIFATKP